MAVVIRMKRSGTKKRPFYHVVAADKRCPRDGRNLEMLGTYDPRAEPEKFEVKMDRVEHWVGNGAQISQTVKQLLARQAKAATTAEQA